VFVKEENSGDEKKASPINIGGATQNGSYVLVNSSLLQELI
jgi:hypothetical protein